MSVSSKYDSGWGWFAKEGFNGSVSNTPQPSELTIPGFPTAAAWPTRVVIAYNARFLLVFFPF